MSDFDSPWTIVEHKESFEIVSRNNAMLGIVYFENEPVRRGIMRRLNREDARRMAMQIVKLPETMAELRRLRAARDEPA